MDTILAVIVVVILFGVLLSGVRTLMYARNQHAIDVRLAQIGKGW